MKKTIARKSREQAFVSEGISTALEQLTLPMMLASEAMKSGLLAFVQQMGMLAFRELLHEEAPDRVLLTNTVQHLQPFTSPVSWKNGRWHHAIPFSLDGLDETGMAKRAHDLVGLVHLCIPEDDVPVPILVRPVSPALSGAAQAEAKIAEEGLAQRGVSLIEVGRAGDQLALGDFVERVQTNITSAPIQ